MKSYLTQAKKAKNGGVKKVANRESRGSTQNNRDAKPIVKTGVPAPEQRKKKKTQKVLHQQ